MAKAISREDQLPAEHEKKPGLFKRLFGGEHAEEKGKFETAEKERGATWKQPEAAAVEHEHARPEAGKEHTLGFMERLFGHEEERKAYETETGDWAAKHKIATSGAVVEEEVQQQPDAEKFVVATEQRRVTAEVRPLEEKATRKVIEERVPSEHVRYVEEVQRLAYPKVKDESGVTTIVDTKEIKLPVERRLIGTQQIRMPVEHVKIYEEIVPVETIHVFEEAEKQRRGQQEGPTIKEGGVEHVQLAAPTRRLVQEGDITGIVEEIRRFEEVERFETRRIVDEHVWIESPIALRDFERQYEKKKGTTTTLGSGKEMSKGETATAMEAAAQ